MVKEKIITAYETMADRYNQLIDTKPHNAYYDRPNTLQLMGNVNGLHILDAACGPGKYAEELLQQGATVTGFDISPKMVRHAQERNANKAEFFLHDLSQPFSFAADNSFDKIVCALALHYVEDWNNTIKEFHRVLKHGGELIISIEHPFFEYNYFKSENYFATEQVNCVWKGFGQPIEVNSYRRSLTDSLKPITDNGFYIDKLIEPKPTAEFEKLDPRHFEELNKFPGFLCIKAVRKT